MIEMEVRYQVFFGNYSVTVNQKNFQDVHYQFHRLWSLKWDSDWPISAIKCCPKNKHFAVGDNSGHIRVYKDSTKESFSQAHWHSLSIQALQLSQDGVQLYSGGHEGKN